MPSAVQQRFDNFRKDLNKRLHTENAVTNLLASIEKETGIDRSFMVLGIVGLFALYLIFGYYAGLVCNVMGCACVVCTTILTIDGTRSRQDTRMLILTYWVILGLFWVVDFIFAWFPLYWIVKCGIVLYLYLPFTRGAQKLYDGGIRPFGMCMKMMDKLFGKFNDKVTMDDEPAPAPMPDALVGPPWPHAWVGAPWHPAPPPGAANVGGVVQCNKCKCTII